MGNGSFGGKEAVAGDMQSRLAGGVADFWLAERLR
jgi:hypothetical protein